MSIEIIPQQTPIEYYEEIIEDFKEGHRDYYFGIELKKGKIEIIAQWHSIGGLEYDVFIDKTKFQDGGILESDTYPDDFLNPDTDYLFYYLVTDILSNTEIQIYQKNKKRLVYLTKSEVK